MVFLKKIEIAIHFIRQMLRVYLVKRLSRTELECMQKKKVLKHLRFLVSRSPYVNKLSEMHGGIVSWQSWPLMSKNIVMDNFDQHNTRGISLQKALSVAEEAERTRDFKHDLGDVTVGLSSGTSGTRGIFMVSPTERAIYISSLLNKALPGWWGRAERVALVLRANSSLYTSVQRGKIKFGFFDLFTPFETMLKNLEEYTPTILVAPASVLRAIADSKSPLKNTVMRVYSVAEVLERDDRKIIEEYFGSVCHQMYQCTEGFLGITCEHGTLHLNEDLALFEQEVLPPTADGRRRFNPIVTDFTRTTQPIIRYKMNDILVLRKDPCPCGSSYLAIDSIEGRLDDVIMLYHVEDPRKLCRMFPDVLHRAMAHAFVDAVANYRIIQEATQLLCVEIEWRSKESLTDDTRKQTVARITASIENACKSCHVITPCIAYRDYVFSPSHNKLRRIMREKNALS